MLIPILAWDLTPATPTGIPFNGTPRKRPYRRKFNTLPPYASPPVPSRFGEYAEEEMIIISSLDLD